MFCPQCGTNLQGNEDFCSNCGASLKESKEVPNTNKSKTKPDFKKYKIPFIITSSTIVVLLVGIFIYSKLVGFINILKTRLNDQDAPVIYSSFNGGLHTINAISLVQDIDNPKLYYIGVYDNNYPGEKRYVNLECKKDTCVTKANNYYSRSNQPVRISPSLEYDLSYFNN